MSNFNVRHAGVSAMLLAGAAVVALVGLNGEASAHSQRVKNSCRGDYHSFCPGYPLDSASLRQCMRSHGKAVSLACRRALAAEGEIPAKWAR